MGEITTSNKLQVEQVWANYGPGTRHGTCQQQIEILKNKYTKQLPLSKGQKTQFSDD